METGQTRNAVLAAFLSAVFPGLGQFYNRQWAKGAGFLVTLVILAIVLLGSVDPQTLIDAARTGAPAENAGTLLLLSVLILALALWSIVDAARSAKRSSR